MKKAIIFDADGTTFDCSHRLHYLNKEPKDWNSFHEAMKDDEPIAGVMWMAIMLQKARKLNEFLADDFAILISTARHEPYRDITTQKYKESGLFPDKIYMRKDGDFRPDYAVKSDMYLQMIEDGYDPILAVDDRPEVCDIWRSFGLTVLQNSYDDTTSKFSGKIMMTLMVGPSGAGKSTFAKNMFKSGDIISSDKIREDEGLGHSIEDLNLTFKLCRGYAKARLEAGLHTVIDATNLKKKDRLNFTRLVPKSALIQYILVDRDYDDKVSSKGSRDVSIMDRHHSYFRDVTMKDMKEADGLHNVIVLDKRQKK